MCSTVTSIAKAWRRGDSIHVAEALGVGAKRGEKRHKDRTLQSSDIKEKDRTQGAMKEDEKKLS